MDNFDWLADGECTLDNVLPHVRPGAWVLDLGCGTSSFATKLCMVCPVPVNVVCLDFSWTGVHLTRQLCREQFSNAEIIKPTSIVHFVQADATKMPFRGELFDVVLDKGTTDSVLKMDDEEKSLQMCREILSESLRLLSSSGVYLQITDEDPDLRMSLLQELLSKECDSNNISISHKKISEEGMWEYFMYALRKNRCMNKCLY